MRAEGEILLVSCYELGHPPLGVAWPAAFLEARGFHPAIADLSLARIESRDIERARLVAISTPMHTAVAIGVELARRVREINPQAHVAFVGHYAVLNRAHLLLSCADSILGGEIEEDLVRLAEALERGDRAGIDEAPRLEKLRFVPPSRHGLAPLDRYAKLVIGGQTRLAASVESSRGCKHLCRHCPIPPVYEGRVFMVPEEIVLADVEAIVRQGGEHITFSDPDFLNAPKHAQRIAAALHHAFPSITFDFTAKVSHLIECEPLIAELRRFGCVFIVSAIESLSDRVLEILDKGHTRSDVLRVFDIAKREDIALRPSLLPFTPWSTRSDYLELFDLIEARELAMHVDPVQMAVRLLVPPGSLLETHEAMLPHLCELDRGQFTWTWKHPDPGMDRLAEEVGTIVAEAADTGEDTFETFTKIARAAGSSADFGALRRMHEARARDVPKLTEPWFC